MEKSSMNIVQNIEFSILQKINALQVQKDMRVSKCAF